MFFRKPHNQPAEAPQPSVRMLPLLCPEHSTVLILEAREHGEWAFYCPVCRLATRPAVQPVQATTGPLPPGALLHARRARERMTARLTHAKVVLLGDRTTDSLIFANLHTVGEHQVIRDHDSV